MEMNWIDSSQVISSSGILYFRGKQSPSQNTCMAKNCMKAAFSSNFDDLELKKFCFENYIYISLKSVFFHFEQSQRYAELDNSVKPAFNSMH